MIETAVILAGGLGTRLRPLTDTTPKPLLPIKGKPIVQHIIENLQRQGVTKIILSVGYKAEEIKKYFGSGKKWGIKISYSYETEPLGTGGAVRQAALKLKKPFFLLWGDNVMDINILEMISSYHADDSLAHMALTQREDVENFGVATLERNKIVSFIEKPKREEAPSQLINAGAFIIDPQCLVMLPAGKSSLERDCFEKLAPLGKISYYHHQGQWYPTDTIEKYSIACQEFIPYIDFAQKKVIIADVDETICHSCQQITEEMAKQITTLIQKGYTFAFISGTKTEDIYAMISSRLQEEHHLLGTTGTNYTIVRKGGVGEIKYNKSLRERERQDITTAFEKLMKEYTIHPLTSKEDQLQNRESQITFSALGRNAPAEAKALFDPQGEKRKQWITFLKQHLDEQKYDFNIGGTTSIDVTRKGVDKAWGIKQFVKYNAISLPDIVYFGDKLYPGGNDYPTAKIVDCIRVKNPEETLEKLKRL